MGGGPPEGNKLKHCDCDAFFEQLTVLVYDKLICALGSGTAAVALSQLLFLFSFKLDCDSTPS